MVTTLRNNESEVSGNALQKSSFIARVSKFFNRFKLRNVREKRKQRPTYFFRRLDKVYISQEDIVPVTSVADYYRSVPDQFVTNNRYCYIQFEGQIKSFEYGPMTPCRRLYDFVSESYNLSPNEFYISNGVKIFEERRYISDYLIADQLFVSVHLRLFGGYFNDPESSDGGYTSCESEDYVIIFVTLMIRGRLTSIPIMLDESLEELYSLVSDLTGIDHFRLYFRDRELMRRQVASEYNLSENCFIQIREDRLLGGSWSRTLKKTFPIINRSEKITIHLESKDVWIKFFEDLGLFCLNISNIAWSKADEKNDRIAENIQLLGVPILNFLKLQTPGPVIQRKMFTKIINFIKNTFSTELQSSHPIEYLKQMRQVLDDYNNFKETTLFKKLHKFSLYILANGLFEYIGIDLDACGFTKLHQEALKSEYHLGASFAICCVDTLTFVLERGYQCAITGNMDPIFHSGSTYEKWFQDSSDLEREAHFLSNPKPVIGKSRFKYFHDLNENIEKGEAILKNMVRGRTYEKHLVEKLLGKLKMIKSVEMTKTAAQKERRAPFSVLIHGGSSVAKSTFSKMLFYHYGHVFKLPTDDEYRFVRNPADPYWVNFNSSQWCVQLDDIAYLNPNSAKNGDPSLLEMLQVVNNVPYIPVQADLADKGKTPLVSRFVVATTNTMHLNAQAYFSCPFAVQRRFPYVISIMPKEQYSRNGGMINPDSLPPLQENCYPDYWRISILEPKQLEGGKTEYITTNLFEDIREFMLWFNDKAMHFEDIQDKAMGCNDIIRDVEFCAFCDLPMGLCEGHAQNGDIQEIELDEYGNEIIQPPEEFVTTWVEDMTQAALRRCYYTRDIVQEQSKTWKTYGCYGLYWLFVQHNIFYVSGILARAAFYKTIIDGATVHDSTVPQKVMRIVGDAAERRIGFRPKFFMVLLTVFTTLFTMHSLMGKFFNMMPSKSRKSDEEIEAEKRKQKEEESFKIREMQTAKNKDVVEREHALHKVLGSKPIAKNIDTQENVWYNDKFECTTFDVSAKTLSWKGLSDDEVHKLLSKNLTLLYMYMINEEGKVVFQFTRGFCIRGRVYMINAHAVPDNLFKIKLINGPTQNGIETFSEFTISKRDFYIDAEKDVAIFLAPIPPRKSIVELFPPKNIAGQYVGYLLKLDLKGEIFTHQVANIRRVNNYAMEGAGVVDVWSGIASPRTAKGDCGSLLLVRNGYGPMILGMHALGEQNLCGSLSITQEYLKLILDDEKFQGPVANPPRLNSESTNLQLGKLHNKSAIRYIEDGYAEVYGSLLGFRPRRKSSVEKTIINGSLMQRGYTHKYTKPDMVSWRPFHLALRDMVTPANDLLPDIIDKATDAFIADIHKNLDPKWFKEIMIYDIFTAVNGAPGVTFIDKLNRNTSMGNPWKKTKKHYLNYVEPIHGLDEPVEFVEEVTDRIDDILQKYYDGERYAPVFCAHLKDEAVTFKKAKMGKTRVFTGAPVDWSIVVRMFLLSTVRVMQFNKEVFEAAPGTIAQSTDWQKLREFVTKFGDDRMIAGDYGKFDKRMSPKLILAAFKILKSLCAKAGYSEKELRVIDCIAEDTAFPMTDFNGDIIQFYGSNPSGHPLTVIINSLVNSLYIRYCYFILNPKSECTSFRDNVALMTYGDDNMMGVSKKAPWFNHTSISKTLDEYGITYTMADKEAESIPYIHIDEVSFLKRTWRFDKDVGAYLCPLDHDSIEKSLMVSVKSKSISREAQILQIIGTAVREYFFYGKEIFEEKVKMFQDVIIENKLELYVEDSTFPQWEELKELFLTSHRVEDQLN